jgi:hypothetical protein
MTELIDRAEADRGMSATDCDQSRDRRKGSQVTNHQPIVPQGILNVNLKAKDIDNVKWVAKHLIMNLEILAALDKTDPRYEVYKEAVLKDTHNIDFHVQTVL